jgi:hypothetical protein
MATETASHILCECVRVALAALRFCRLRKHFIEPSVYDETSLDSVLH